MTIIVIRIVMFVIVRTSYTATTTKLVTGDIEEIEIDPNIMDVTTNTAQEPDNQLDSNFHFSFIHFLYI